MKWLPYHRFELVSPMRRQDAVAAMAAHVEPEQVFRWRWPSGKNDTRFEGEMTADGFNVRRILGYRNSFAPAVQGEIHAAGGMTRIVVTMRPLVFVIVFAVLWCSVALSFALAGPPMAWFSVVMVAFLYLMTMGGFWFEASKQEAVLRQIFNAEVT